MQLCNLLPSYRLKEYTNVVIGSEFVTSLMESKKTSKGFFSWGASGAAEERQAAAADTREEGVRIGQAMIRMDLMHHCVDEHDFEDAHLFYRQSSSPTASACATSRADCLRAAGSFATKTWSTSARGARRCPCCRRTSRGGAMSRGTAHATRRYMRMPALRQ